MEIWTVANQKGGVGKTTTVVSLAGLLAEDGCKVLMVDLDPQSSLTQYFGVVPDTLQKSIFTLFRDRQTLDESQAAEAVVELSFAGLSLLPASPLLATVEKLAAPQGGMGLVLRQILERLSARFDYVLIDTPPTLGVLLVNALAAADRLIIPVQTEYLALKGLERMMRTMGMIAKSQGRQVPYVVVPTLYDKRTSAAQQCLVQLRQQYPEAIWPSVVSVDTKFRDASRAGLPPSLHCAESRGVDAYRTLLREKLQVA